MGSHSDLPTLQPCLTTLTSFSIPFTVRITSAHTPMDGPIHSHRCREWNSRHHRCRRGRRTLTRHAAANTSLPVIGVPVKASSTNGMDSLLRIVQMPRGVLVTIGNGLNAALLAAGILGVLDERIQAKVELYAKEERTVRETDMRLVEKEFEEFLRGMGE